MNELFDSKYGRLVRAAAAEFIGTTVLVMFGCGSCALGKATVQTALAFGLTLMSLIAALGPLSGCHVNPAVTVGLLIDGKVDIISAVAYVVVQVLGSLAGAGLLYAVLPKNPDLLGVEYVVEYGICHCELSIGVSWWKGIIIEFVITFLFVLVICTVAESNLCPAPIIGLALTAGHLFAVPLTGASMNTARAFGPAVIKNKWKDHYVYWVGPLIGGGLAGVVHRFLYTGADGDGGQKPKSVQN
ncbi:aquaporin-like [Oppia nitens]|uniref:aquaporin-like n=1 Tax=Oppia nitens TaxID=1686743 RepID=UPI0023DBBD36|nr:aquaporin-like [Oppia nitens]